MQNKFYYSSKTKGFYLSSVHEQIPDDKIEITESYYNQLMQKQSEGLAIMEDKNGVPIAVPQPSGEWFVWNGINWEFDKVAYADFLQKAKKNAMREIDDLAGEIYFKFSRFEPEYKIRKQQARAFKENGYTGEIPPQVKMFAMLNNYTAQQATDLILTKAEQTRQAVEKLGEVRMQKYKIHQQETVEDVKNVKNELIKKAEEIAQTLDD